MKWNGANCTQTEIAEKVGVSLPYVNRIIRGREQIVNKTFVKMMDELGYDVEITYKKGSRLRLRQIGIVKDNILNCINW